MYFLVKNENNDTMTHTFEYSKSVFSSIKTCADINSKKKENKGNINWKSDEGRRNVIKITINERPQLKCVYASAIRQFLFVFYNRRQSC